jgi:hypothetical protein
VISFHFLLAQQLERRFLLRGLQLLLSRSFLLWLLLLRLDDLLDLLDLDELIEGVECHSGVGINSSLSKEDVHFLVCEGSHGLVVGVLIVPGTLAGILIEAAGLEDLDNPHGGGLGFRLGRLAGLGDPDSHLVGRHALLLGRHLDQDLPDVDGRALLQGSSLGRQCDAAED